jgi:N-acetylglucosaminyldiphosphoundecaprenol N-acetyl-beta-D-mannosaminyltransferase
MTTRAFVNKIATSASAYPERVFSERGRVHTCVNPYYYHVVKSNPELYADIDGLFVDGMTMCWWIRLFWGVKVPRLSFDMSGMAADLFSRLNSPECTDTIYFIGSKQEQLEATVEQIRTAYPQIAIAGFRNGYFRDEEERRDAIRRIVEVAPDFTVVGMGSPLQERFALDLREAGYRGIVFTCGGFLHQTATGINYYPDWINRFNLRAFYRLAHEKGMFGRLFEVLVGFPIRFAIDSFGCKFSSK